MTHSPSSSAPDAFGPGRFRSLTGLSDKALRLYAERGILEPLAVDPATGYRSYGADQVRDGIALDLLRRAGIPLDDLASEGRLRIDEHRERLAAARAMEDFFLDLAERVATGDPAALVGRTTDAPPAHWVACEVPFGVSMSADDLEETFTSMAVDLPRLDDVLLRTLRDEGVEVLAESWTSSVAGTVPRLRLAHRLADPVPVAALRAVRTAAADLGDPGLRVTTGTLPARRELVYSAPDGWPTDDPGLSDTALSSLATIAFARRLAEDGDEALDDTARRRIPSTSLFDPSATPEDVFDLTIRAD